MFGNRRDPEKLLMSMNELDMNSEMSNTVVNVFYYFKRETF